MKPPLHVEHSRYESGLVWHLYDSHDKSIARDMCEDDAKWIMHLVNSDYARGPDMSVSDTNFVEHERGDEE